MTQITAHNLDPTSALELKALFGEQGSPASLVEPQPVPGRFGLLQDLQLVIHNSDNYVPLLLTIWLVSKKRLKLSVSGRTVEFEYSQDSPASMLKRIKDWIGT